MQVRNASRNQILWALNLINTRYANNIKFVRLDDDGQTRQGDEKWIVTLGVVNSAEKGSKRSPSGRRIAAACWHVYGRFMDALPPGSEIVSSTGDGRRVTKPGDEWHDWSIGRNVRGPIMASKGCRCARHRIT